MEATENNTELPITSDWDLYTSTLNLFHLLPLCFRSTLQTRSEAEREKQERVWRHNAKHTKEYLHKVAIQVACAGEGNPIQL